MNQRESSPQFNSFRLTRNPPPRGCLTISLCDPGDILLNNLSNNHGKYSVYNRESIQISASKACSGGDSRARVIVKRISANNAFQRKIFPVLWFGVLAIVFVGMALGRVYRQAPFALFVPIGMAVFGYFLMKNLIFDLVDEVYDDGDFLLVRKGMEEERVALSNIMNVSASSMTNPPRVSLRLVTPGKFGQEIVFSPIRPFTLNPFAKNPVAEDLIVRVDQARSHRLR
jgi:hypothetical protein